ncbi:hypothetical protein AYI69_g2025 [Smittium culicis]|uniref:RecQ-mediated genome instability protein 1 n=1 Tax=Smittium culicis TaxID=133412 RepID=A0A1R1YNP3_9FUNG|nr:hypothetical protein AYI69_g2025 [Smittium culicis]
MSEFGYPVSIQELFETPSMPATSSQSSSWAGKTIRILALLKEYFPVDELAIASDPIQHSREDSNNQGKSLTIKTNLIKAGILSKGGLYLIIGNVNINADDGLFLQATTVTDVCGLDPNIYWDSIKMQRSLLSTFISK